MDSHLFVGHARARHVMRVNYCGFSAVTRPISVVRRAKVQAAAQAGSDVQQSLGAKAGTSDGFRTEAEVLRFMA